MLSPDNYVQAPDFSQSYNRYSYCANNPLKYVDPSGMQAVYYTGQGSLHEDQVRYYMNEYGRFGLIFGQNAPAYLDYWSDHSGWEELINPSFEDKDPYYQQYNYGYIGSYEEMKDRQKADTYFRAQRARIESLVKHVSEVLGKDVYTDPQGRLYIWVSEAKATPSNKHLAKVDVTSSRVYIDFGSSGGGRDPYSVRAGETQTFESGTFYTLPTLSKRSEDGMIGISVSLTTATVCAIECPPVAIALGALSLSANSVLMYNNIATKYNDGTLNWTTTNVIDGAIYIGSALNPIFAGVSTWLYTLPTKIYKETK